MARLASVLVSLAITLLFVDYSLATASYLKLPSGPSGALPIGPAASSQNPFGGDRNIWAAFWLRTTSNSGIIFGFGAPGNGWALGISGGNFAIYCGSTPTAYVITGATVGATNWKHFSVATNFTSDSTAFVVIHVDGGAPTTYSVTGGAFATATPNFPVAVGNEVRFSINQWGTATEDGSTSFDLGHFYIGEGFKYAPHRGFIADMMIGGRGPEDFYNPGLCFWTLMEEADTGFGLGVESIVNTTSEYFFSVFPGDPTIDLLPWTCDGGATDPWEQCDGGSGCRSTCRCDVGLLPNADGTPGCSPPRPVRSSAVRLNIASNNQIPAFPSPLVNFQRGFTVAMWISVSGSWTGGLPFFTMSNAANTRSHGVGIVGSNSFNLTFLDASGAFAGNPESRDPYQFPSNTFVHFAISWSPEGGRAETQMPPYKIFINGVVVRGEVIYRTYPLNNVDLDTTWSLSFVPFARSGATVRIMRPQVWLQTFGASDIGIIMKGIQPQDVSIRTNQIFLATDEGTPITTTMNIARSRNVTIGNNWVASTCGANGVEAWEQCDGGAGCASGCVCASGFSLSRTTLTCIGAPVLESSTVNRAQNAPFLFVTFSYPSTPSLVSVTFEGTSAPTCTVDSANTTSLSAGRWRVKCDFTLAPPTPPSGTGVPLFATVTVDGTGSNRAQVATVVSTPSIFESATKYGVNATEVVINGANFGTIVNELSAVLALDSGTRLTCSVFSTSGAQLRCNPIGTITGSFIGAEVVRAGGRALNSGVRVGVIVVVPVLSQTTFSQAQTNRSLSILGSFDLNAGTGSSTPADYIVTLVFGNGTTVGCTTTSVTASQLLCTAASNLGNGALSAFLTFFGGRSNTVQIRTIRDLPVITSSTPEFIPINSETAVVRVCGTNFGSVPLEHLVTLSREGGETREIIPDTVIGNCIEFDLDVAAPGRIFAIVTVLGVGSSSNVTVTTAVAYPFLYAPDDSVRTTFVERFTAPTGLTQLVGANLDPETWTLQTFIINQKYDQEAISAGTVNFTTIHTTTPGTVINCNSRARVGSDVISCNFGITAAQLNQTIYGRITSASFPNLPYVYITEIVAPPTINSGTEKMVETTFQLTVTGSGFNPTALQNFGHFYVGGVLVGSDRAEANSNPSTLYFKLPLNTFLGKSGVLSISLGAYGVNSSQVAIYTIFPAPRITNSSQITISEGARDLIIRGSNFLPGSEAAFMQVYFQEPSSGVLYSIAQSSNATHLIMESVSNLRPGLLQAAVVVYDGPNLKKKRALDPEIILNGLTYYTIGRVVPLAAIASSNLLRNPGSSTISVVCVNCEPVTTRIEIRVGSTSGTVSNIQSSASGQTQVTLTFTANLPVTGPIRMRVYAYSAWSPEATIGEVVATPIQPFESQPDAGALLPPTADSNAPGRILGTPGTDGVAGGPNTGGIIAGVVIVVLVLIGAAIAVYFIIKKKKKSAGALARATIPPKGDGDGSSVWDQGEEMQADNDGAAADS